MSRGRVNKRNLSQRRRSRECSGHGNVNGDGEGPEGRRMYIRRRWRGSSDVKDEKLHNSEKPGTSTEFTGRDEGTVGRGHIEK